MRARLSPKNAKLSFLARRCLQCAIRLLSFEEKPKTARKENILYARRGARLLRPKERHHDDKTPRTE